MLAFCLMLTFATSPALAKAQASSNDTSSDTASKKSKKKAKKAAAATAAEEDSASKTASADKGAPAESTGNMAVQKKTTAKVSSPEIAADQASGKVWVNTDSGVYHKGGRWYGKTKAGKFMTESEAKAAGYKAAQKE